MTGIHSTALVDPAAEIDESAQVGAFCVVGGGARIGAGARLHNGVTLQGDVTLSPGVEVFPGAVLGAPPQIVGFDASAAKPLVVGARTVIRENATLQAGAENATRVGEDCYLMVGVHIPHDCQIGDRCVLANTVTFGGHAIVEDDVWIGGLAAIHQHSRIGRHAFVAGGSILVGDVVPFAMASGHHAAMTGLNITGLKRRRFSKDRLQALNKAFRMIFDEVGLFDDRVAAAATAFESNADVQAMIDFIKADRSRPLCQARR